MADVTPILINQLTSQTTLQDTDYFIVGGDDAKKITVAQMKEALGINSLNTNMNNIKNDMGDLIKVVTQTGPHTFALDAYTSIEASSHVTLPKLDGYTRLIYFLKPNGNPSIIAAGPNTNWVTNTSTQKVNAVRLDSVGIFIKNI